MKRMVLKLYFARSHRCILIFVLLMVFGIVFIPHFINNQRKHIHHFVNEKEKLHKELVPKLTSTSLEISSGQFKLGGKPFTILGGSIHYFRVVPQYWDDRLAKLKAMGLNTITTSIPWSLHEEFKGEIKFDEARYDLKLFIEKAKKHGLHVILRPGPYVDAQLDLGGLPSWLIEECGENVRSSNTHFLSFVERYFKKLFTDLTPHEYSNGGPIIAWQIENKFLSIRQDSHYIPTLKKIMLDNGVRELMFTSDSIISLSHSLVDVPGVLKAVSMELVNEEMDSLEKIKKLQPGKPLFISDLWIGHQDYWGKEHNTEDIDNLGSTVAKILAMGASFNFYMFHGGTNFGFIGGAANGKKHEYSPIITSYDFDAPLNEAGDVTKKYKDLRKILKAHAPQHSLPKTLPDIPHNIIRKAYEPVKMNSHLPLYKMFKHVHQAIEVKQIVPMEKLMINKNGGQSCGIVVYRTKLSHGAKKLNIQSYRDWAQVIVGSKLIATLDPFNFEKSTLDVEKTRDIEIELKFEENKKDEAQFLDILVENHGRGYNNVLSNEYKGITGDVQIDGQKPEKWTIYPLSFHDSLTSSMFKKDIWGSPEETNNLIFPGFFKGVFTIPSKPRDTFLDMTGWGKGVLFVNDHLVGRYWKLGPQQTLYIPSVWLQRDENTIVIFEFEKRNPDGLVKFSQNPILDKLLLES